MNYPEIGLTYGFISPKFPALSESAVRKPSDTVYFADSGGVVNITEGNADKWGDGHSSIVKSSKLGFNRPQGHPLALWDRK